MFLSDRRRDRENHTLLGVMALANSGDTKQINKQLSDWEREQ